jgi:hypothetical protein
VLPVNGALACHLVPTWHLCPVAVALQVVSYPGSIGRTAQAADHEGHRRSVAMQHPSPLLRAAGAHPAVRIERCGARLG